MPSQIEERFPGIVCAECQDTVCWCCEICGTPLGLCDHAAKPACPCVCPSCRSETHCRGYYCEDREVLIDG